MPLASIEPSGIIIIGIMGMFGMFMSASGPSKLPSCGNMESKFRSVGIPGCIGRFEKSPCCMGSALGSGAGWACVALAPSGWGFECVEALSSWPWAVCAGWSILRWKEWC